MKRIPPSTGLSPQPAANGIGNPQLLHKDIPNVIHSFIHCSLWDCTGPFRGASLRRAVFWAKLLRSFHVKQRGTEMPRGGAPFLIGTVGTHSLQKAE